MNMKLPNLKLNKPCLRVPILSALLCVFLSGCDTIRKTRVVTKHFDVCNEDSKEHRSKFILECIKNANPKSDEEPEDWIMKCETMANNLFCKDTAFRVTQECNKSSFLDSCGYSWNELSREEIKN